MSQVSRVDLCVRSYYIFCNSRGHSRAIPLSRARDASIRLGKMASHCKLPRPTGCTLPCHNRSVRQAEGGRFRLAGHNSAKLLYSPGFFRAGGEGRQVVLDVGSWEGHDLLSALAVPGMPKDQLRIHAFEPVPAIRTKLTAHMADMPQVFIHPHGIGSSNRTACFALDSGVRARELRPTATALQRPCASPASILDVAAAVVSQLSLAALRPRRHGRSRGGGWGDVQRGSRGHSRRGDVG